MEHSSVGGSVIGVVIQCNAFPRMTNNAVTVVEDAAEEGTAAHECSEFCFKLGIDAVDTIGMTFNGYVVNDEMAEHVQTYLGYVRALLIKTGGELHIEKRVTLYSVGEDAFGTADVLVVCPDRIYSVDFKYGRGLVNHVNNSQNAFYGIGANQTMGLNLPVTGVIVQPRYLHVEGPIRSHDYSVNDLIDWELKIRTAVNNSRQPMIPTSAGEHCKYCPAAENCRARMQRTIDLVGLDAPLDKLNDDELEAFYREIPIMKKQFEKVSELMERIARDGKLMHDHKLVKRVKHAICKDDEALIKESGKTRAELSNLKLKSKTDLIKIVGKELVNKHFITPDGGSVLAPLSDGRPAVGRGAGDGVFESIAEIK